MQNELLEMFLKVTPSRLLFPAANLRKTRSRFAEMAPTIARVVVLQIEVTIDPDCAFTSKPSFFLSGRNKDCEVEEEGFNVLCRCK